MNKIQLNFNKCVHCGACTALCESKALSLDSVSWSLNFDERKCIGCLLCLKACPLRAISE